jgi:hypothetical protein
MPTRLELSGRFLLSESVYAGRGTSAVRETTEILDVETGRAVWNEDDPAVGLVDLCAFSETDFLLSFVRDGAIQVERYRLAGRQSFAPLSDEEESR